VLAFLKSTTPNLLRRAELDDLPSLFANEMGCPTRPRSARPETNLVLIPVNPKTWLEWTLEHQAAKAAAGRRSTGKRNNIAQLGQLSIRSNLREE
jgi:hypothetical protein